jgi:hypothetical protein
MVLNGSGIRDPARVLKISPTTVIEELKKERLLAQVNTQLLQQISPTVVDVVQHLTLPPRSRG